MAANIRICDKDYSKLPTGNLSGVFSCRRNANAAEKMMSILEKEKIIIEKQ